MTNDGEKTQEDESEKILNMHSKLVDRDDILTEDNARHKTHFYINIQI